MEESPSLFLYVPLFVLLLGASITGLAFGLSYLFYKIFGRTSGLNRLSELYPATAPPEGMMFRKQRMGVGQVYFRNSVDICISPQGLYMWVRPFLSKYRPASIPWSAFRDPRSTILRMQKAVRLTVGEPPVTSVVLSQTLFEKMKPYLRTSDL